MGVSPATPVPTYPNHCNLNLEHFTSETGEGLACLRKGSPKHFGHGCPCVQSSHPGWVPADKLHTQRTRWSSLALHPLSDMLPTPPVMKENEIERDRGSTFHVHLIFTPSLLYKEEKVCIMKLRLILCVFITSFKVSKWQGMTINIKNI